MLVLENLLLFWRCKIIKYSCDACSEELDSSEFIGFNLKMDTAAFMNPNEGIEKYEFVVHKVGECLGNFLLSFFEETKEINKLTSIVIDFDL